MGQLMETLKKKIANYSAKGAFPLLTRTKQPFKIKRLLTEIEPGLLHPAVVAILFGISCSKWLSKSLIIDTTEYISNAEVLKAQENTKKSFSLETTTLNGTDEYMHKAPNLEPKKGFRLKSPNGHDAYYFENELGEPFLPDDGDNLWIWAGVDVENPNDDWLVRTPEGNVLNFYLDGSGNLHSNFIGNEKDLKVVSSTNLGTIVGFVSDEILDLHFKEIPSSSVQYFDISDRDRIAIPPALLEEGFLEFNQNNYTPAKKQRTFQEFTNPENPKQDKNRLSSVKYDPFLQSISDSDWNRNKFTLSNNEKKSAINPDKKNSALLTLLKGIDINDLPRASDYATKE